MKIFLAPMHGILDAPMRDLLTHLGDYDACVTEFIRVVDLLHPRHKFYTACPELRLGGRTAASTPVIVQLLGGNPEMMAANAKRACELGALGIDLNFGCPSPTVNKHAGGAILLEQPELIHQIVCAVRRAVPQTITVSAKIRLGYHDTELALDNAHAVASAGASYLTVHARTKVDAYRHPARWEWLGKIRQEVNVPILANGDIYSVDDYLRCQEMSGCQDIMLARGALTRPDLARQIRASAQQQVYEPVTWPILSEQLYILAGKLLPFDTSEEHKQSYLAARVKQWLKFLQNHYPEASQLAQQLRPLQRKEEIFEVLARRGEKHSQ